MVFNMEKLLFNWASIFYTLTFIWALLKSNKYCYLFYFIGIFLNFFSVVICLYHTIPLVPLFEKSRFIPLIYSFVCLLFLKHKHKNVSLSYITSVSCFLSLLFCFFPKDFYLPFLQTKTIFAFLFFICEIIGVSFYLLCGVLSLQRLVSKNAIFEQSIINNQIKWGIFFQTISMFSGEIWSYLGWGFPIVWDDPAVVGMIVVWFYYACFLHLYLTKLWTVKKRASMVILGAVITFVFSYMPELGPFRLPDLAILLHSGRL